MYARLAKWEGAEADTLRRSTEEMKARASEGPPPGVPAKGFMMLIDPDSGRSMALVLFETEEDMRKGDEALNAMSPTTTGPAAGQRTSVEMYEVAIDIRL
jgi:hypothetical protein